METQDAWQAFSSQAADVLGHPLAPEALSQMEKLYTLTVEANLTTNITRITTLPDFLSRHLLDSLTLAPLLDGLGDGISMADVGSGGGYPVLPLAILFPDIRFTAIESVQKKARIIQQLAESLNLNNISVEAERVELLGQNKKFREQFDVVVARAVAKMRVLCELCLPLTQEGGTFVAMKSESVLESELDEAQKALQILGGTYRDWIPTNLPGLETHGLILIEKSGSTPIAYPRNPGTPSKSPL